MASLSISVALTCGQTTSSNCSYLTQPTNPTGSNMVSVCQYTVCKCTPDVCRIRLDFTSHNISVETKLWQVLLDVFNISQLMLGGFPATHLSRQAYSICIRRNEGFCAICYVPSIVPPAPTAADQASYGLDKGAAAVHDLDCRFDYLQIPNAEAFPLPVAMPGTPLTNMIGKQLFCGRIFNVDVAAALPASVCSTTAPFRLGFSTGGGEFTNMATPEKNELMGAPGGIVGFSLDYRQIPC
eukprot:TCALIF_11356-PC protein Name:"Protein of unknown function" AED:0.24 eAED:0.24 QI:0/0.71/0.87/1/0.85/0.75/8/132/239